MADPAAPLLRLQDLNAWYGASADDSAAAFAGGGSYGELDLSAALSYKLDPVTIGVKYTWYNYTSGADAFVKDVELLCGAGSVELK